MKMINSKPKGTVLVSLYDLPKPKIYKSKVDTSCVNCKKNLYVYTRETLTQSTWIVCPACDQKMIMVPPPRIKINLIKP